MVYKISTMTLNYLVEQQPEQPQRPQRPPQPPQPQQPQQQPAGKPVTAAPQSQITLEELVRKVSELKFDGIELAFSPPIVDTNKYGTPEGRRELKELLKKNGLQVSCLTGRLNDETSLKELANLALELGTKKVGFLMPVQLKNQGKSHQEIVEEVKRYAKMAGDLGVVLVYEVHGNVRLNDKPHDILRLFNDVGSPYFKCQFDFMHIMRDCSGVLQSPPLDIIEGEWGKLPAIFLRMLGKHVGDVHADDAILNWTVGIGRTPFGKGFVDFDEAFKALKEIGYEGWITLDIHTIPGDIWKNTIESKQFLENTLKKLNLR